jgi:decaprenyl-phosphate phosphoribosyltransferase
MIISGEINKNKIQTPLPYIMLMRPHHWIKNLFLFLPLFFAGDIFNIHDLLNTGLGFLAFSFVASSIYIINDYKDIEADKKHPEKCNRPIASGTVSKSAAIILFIGCLLAGIFLSVLLMPKFIFILALYFFINLAYSFGLKNISILDIILLSAGFVLRVKAGGVIASVAITQWLNIMFFLLALFMATAKRRDDILLKLQSGHDLRKSIKGYNLEFMNVVLSLLTAIIIVSYLIYTISPEVMERWKTYRLYYTSIFVIAGLLRYLQITFVENNTGSPTKLLYKDRFIQITLILWILSFYVIIYMPNISIFK